MPKVSPIDDAAKVDHSLLNNLLIKNVSVTGVVNYPGFKSNSNFEGYLKLLSDAQPINSNWSKDEKMAFWINAYNAFTIKLINNNWPIKSIRDISSPWKTKFFKIGGLDYDLNTIEHEILRKMGTPEIHFAIVCASYSCPTLLNEAYSSSSLKAQLAKQAKAFVNDPKRNSIEASSIRISQLFNWFKSDFTSKGDLISYLNKYSNTAINSNAKVDYLEYNWSLNNK
jgi:hypothetical protein